MRFDVSKRDSGTLFHHVAQVTRHGQSRGLGRRERGLNKQYLTTNLRPSQTGHYADILIRLPHIAVEARFAQIGHHIFRRHGHIIFLIQRNLGHNLTAYRRQLTL